METHRRGSDGRRFFTTQFKQEQIARVVRQELTLSELARELAVSPSVVRRWQHLSTKGSSAAVASNQEVVPVSELRAAQQRIRDLERALGKKTMEVEILQAARDEVKKDPASTACPSGDGAEDGPDLSDLGDQPRLRLPGERGTPCAVRARGGPRGHGSDPDCDPHAGLIWGTPRPRSRQSGVRDLVQPQAHTARHESERLDPAAGHPATHRSRAPGADPARRSE